MVVVSKEVKVEPKSQPELAEEPPAPSEPIQPEPRQSEPSPRTRAGFDHPGAIVLNAHQEATPEGNGVVGCVCGDICPFDALFLFELLPELSRTFFADARLGPSSV